MDQETHASIIEQYSDNLTLRELVKEYLKVRYIHTNKKAITNRQLKILLTKLTKLSTKDEEKIALATL